MATIVKRGDVYRAQVIRKVGDKRICRSATFTLKSEARNWAAEVEAEILRRRRGLTTGIASNDGKITLHRAIQLYKEERVPGKRGERWEKVRCEKFMRDLPFVGKLVDGVTPTDISDWMRECLKSGLKPSTVNREIKLCIVLSVNSVLAAGRKFCRADDLGA